MNNLLTKEEEDTALLLLNWLMQKVYLEEEMLGTDMPLVTDKKMRMDHVTRTIEELEKSLADSPDLYLKMKARVRILVATKNSLDEAVLDS